MITPFLLTVLSFAAAGPVLAQPGAAEASLSRQVERLGQRLLRQLHTARREGRESLAACLDGTLSQVNSLRRSLHGAHVSPATSVHERRFQQLRRAAEACHPQRKPGTTVVTVIIPKEPTGEPDSLAWGWASR